MSIEARFHLDRGDFSLDVDFNVPARGITAIFGPSGCGKTTLLRAIAGLERSGNGYLRIANETWQDGNYFLPTHRRPLAYVFQEASLFSHLDVRRNLEYGLKRVPQTGRKVSLDRAIDLLGIGHLLDRKPDQLSGGERQRVAIARALAVSPGLLLMDEPLAALDQARKQEVMPYLESIHQELEIPVLYVSHSTDEVARLADHLVLLEKGRVKASGEITAMLSRLDLPLAHGDDAESLIEAVVSGHDETYGLSYLNFSGGRFCVPQRDVAVGQNVRLRIAARDISLTLQQQEGTSILNIFPAMVEEVVDESAAQVMVRLQVGDVAMLSRITRKSATLLDLQPGKAIYVQVKSVALLS
jgi:molybdate transport system ATP-binding protein